MNRKLIASLATIAAIAVLMMSVAVGLTQGAINTSTSAGVTPTTQSAAATQDNGLASATTAATCHSQAAIPLGAAGNFRVLAGTTVTNIGATVVHGNLGVSPGSAVTGFPPGKVTGTIDKANAAAKLAQAALVTAYNNGMGRTNCPTKVAGNIGGKTLTPGLYRSTSSLAISSGTLTLTGKGVFIFQIVSKFTVTSGRHVVLAGELWRATSIGLWAARQPSGRRRSCTGTFSRTSRSRWRPGRHCTGGRWPTSER